MSTKHAVALQAFTHDDRSFSKGELIKGLPANQFADWSKEGVDLVRAATDQDLGREAAPATPKARSTPKPKAAKAPRAARPAPTPAAPASDPAPASAEG